MLRFSITGLLCLALFLFTTISGFAQLDDSDVDDFGESGTSGPEENAAIIDDSMPPGDIKLAILAVLEREPFRFSTAFLKKAIEKGADVNARNKVGDYSVLIKAVENNCRPDTIDFLLKNGANPFATDSIELNDMERIVENEGCVDLLPVFLDNGIDFARKNPESGESLLAHAAGMERSLTVAKKLIELGTRVDSGVLMACSGCKDKDFFNQILEKVADINEANQKGRTALMEFAENSRDTDFIKAIIARGANLEARDKDKNTALVLAAARDTQLKAAEILIEKGADVNAANWLGRTPLLVAAENHNLAVVPLLISKKADVNALTSRGETALTLAVKKSGENCEKAGQELFKKAMSCFVKAAKLRYGEGFYSIGWMFYAGHGVERSREKCIEFYKKAIKTGYIDACYNIGLALVAEKLGEPDVKEAAKWFKLGAERGNTDAMGFLGRWYFTGKTGERDYVKSRYYYGIQVKTLGEENAGGVVEKIGRLERVMTAAQIEEAEKMVAQFVLQKDAPPLD
ncbi:MAG TPA: ankyrin repeat domain-containing protein [Candidatus Rifleibacterium sp.]|nr:ankyrin repeat domain-containing protein [Candidatus Rifleibacterium sp.]